MRPTLLIGAAILIGLQHSLEAAPFAIGLTGDPQANPAASTATPNDFVAYAPEPAQEAAQKPTQQPAPQPTTPDPKPALRTRAERQTQPTARTAPSRHAEKRHRMP